MHHLLAAGMIVLIFAFGTTTSIGTTKALQAWAVSTFDAQSIDSDARRRRPEEPPQLSVAIPSTSGTPRRLDGL